MADIRPKLLIVEDDPGLQRQLRWAYEDYQLFIAGDREEALELLREHAPPVVTLDLGLPPEPDSVTEGMAALSDILAMAPATKVIVASGQGDRENARRAISLGAWDFYQKPIDIDSLGHIVARAFHVHALETENRRLAGAPPAIPHSLGQMITAAPEMLEVARMIKRAAPNNSPVLLIGASGTGKALIARTLHDQSERAGQPFVTINCAAIAEPQLESDLFGSQLVDASGEVNFVPGKIEQSHGGTLFLDEVSALPLSLQARLLHFVDERVVERGGGHSALAADTRIVCTTTFSLEEMTAQGQLRADLLYRLAEIVIRVPSLAERTGDAVLLARHFVTYYAGELNRKVNGLSGDAIAAVDAWTWPGNVRELENRAKRAVMMAAGKLVTAAELDLPNDEDVVINLRAAREAADQQVIRRAMARCDGNISAAARLLGVSRPTLYDLLKTYNLAI